MEYFSQALHSRVAEFSKLERRCNVECIDGQMLTTHVLQNLEGNAHLGLAPNERDVLVYAKECQTNKHITQQELPDVSAETSAYMHTCSHATSASPATHWNVRTSVYHIALHIHIIASNKALSTTLIVQRNTHHIL